MSVDAIKSAAQNVGKTAMDQGTTVVKALGRGFEYLGGVISGAAKTVADWVKSFFNNLPHYFEIAKGYAQFGIQYIRENRTAVAVGSAIGVGLAAIGLGLAGLLTKAEEF